MYTTKDAARCMHIFLVKIRFGFCVSETDLSKFVENAAFAFTNK